MPTICYVCDICKLRYLTEEDAEACERNCLNRRLAEAYNYAHISISIEEGENLTTNGGRNESRK